MLDDFTQPPPEDIFITTCSPLKTPNDHRDIEISFKQGIPYAIDGQEMDSVVLVESLNKIGGTHGVGRIDIVENRLVGIKTRGVYEAPAATILYYAHKELESLLLNRETYLFKQTVSQKYAQLIYDGFWYSDLRLALDNFIDFTQQNVTGNVRLRLYKGNISVLGRDSDFALYNDELSTYDTRNVFSKDAGKGFCYINSMDLRVASIVRSKKPEKL